MEQVAPPIKQLLVLEFKDEMMAIDFGDIANRYATARLDQAMMPFSDPEAYMNNRMQQDLGVDMNGNVRPRSTTIQYGDNGRPETITTKHDVGTQPTVEQPTMAPVPMAQPVAPTAVPPVALPQPGPAVQVAGPAQMPPQPVTAPVAPVAQPSATIQPNGNITSEATTPAVTAPVAPTAVAPAVQQPPATVTPGPAMAAPAAAPAPAPAPAISPNMSQAINDLHSIQSDPAKLASYYGNERNSPEARQLAAAMYKDHVKTEDRAQQAEQLLKSSVETGNFLPLMKEIKSKSTEGSYMKAILFARLGLNDLAKEEQQKLGAGMKYEVAVNDRGEQALIQYNGDGLPMKGFTAGGAQLTPKELAGYAAGALPTKAHLMPSVHGTPVQNAAGEGGLRMYDPRTRQTYVQVGNERRPDIGFTLPTQNVQNVYAAAGAGQMGKQAAEGFTNQPLAPYPGGGAPAGSQGAAPAANAVQIASQLGVPVISGVRDTARQQQLYDESVRAGRTGFMANGNPIARPGTSAHETAQGVDIDTARLTPAQTQALTAQGLYQPMPQKDPNHWEMRPAAGTPVYEQKKQAELNLAAGKENIQVAGKRSESFNKHIDDTITPDAVNGDSISTTRKQQFALFDRPGVDAGKIFGIANGAGAAPGDQRWTMFRDILLGKVSEPADQIKQRAAALGLNPTEQSAVAEYAIANADINSKTLKSTAGPGSVSEAEQKINQQRNVDPTQVPMLGGYNAMAQSQFNGDLAKYKGDWALTSKASNTAELERDWRKEKANLIKTYADTAKERIDYIASMGNTPAAIKEGYKRFPVPTYDANTGTWMKKKPLGSYEK